MRNEMFFIDIFGIKINITLLYKELKKQYERNPKTVTISVLGVWIALAAILISIIYIDNINRKSAENDRLKNIEYKSQIQQLNQMEENINQLVQFVEIQKKKLRESEDTILQLKSEQEKLQPLVETNRSTVESIFRLQEERAIDNISRERWIGFGLGVLASLIASFIGSLVGFAIRKRNERIKQENKNNQNTTSTEENTGD